MTRGRDAGVRRKVEVADELAQIRDRRARGYRPRTTTIEPDASAASYFWAAAAITGGRVPVEGLSRDSLQGDVAFCDCLAQMGCGVQYAAGRDHRRRRAAGGIDVDMNAISDTVQTLAAVALFAEGPDDHSRRGPHPPQGNRPHRRLGHGTAQAGGATSRNGRTGCESSRAAAGRPRSTPTTTIAWP